MTMSRPQIQSIKYMTDFRIYLRNYFYHTTMGALVDILYKRFSTTDVQIDDNLKVSIKIRKRKNIMDTLDFVHDINCSLLELLNSCNILDRIMKDVSLTPEQKDQYCSAYYIIQQISQYTSYLYSAVLVDQTILVIDL